MNNRWLAICAVALSACGGGGGSGNSGPDVDGTARCATISGGGTTVGVSQSNCAGCSASNLEAAIDGDTDTAGTLLAPGVAAGFAGVRATAQPGVVYGGGSTAAAIVGITGDPYLQVAEQLVIRTYLSGSLQEENVFSLNVVSANIVSGGAKNKFSFTTSKPYDAVEFGVWGGVVNYQADYYAFCHG